MCDILVCKSVFKVNLSKILGNSDQRLCSNFLYRVDIRKVAAF